MAGHQDTHAAGNLIHWMGRFETMSSASKKKVARSSKLKELVTGLVDYDPDTMEKLLKQASKACVASLKRKAVPVKAKQVRVPAESEDLTPPPAKRAKLPRFVRKPLPSITNIQRSTTADTISSSEQPVTPQTTRADDAPSQASDPPTPQTTRADDAPSQASDPPTPQTTRADDAPSQASDPPTPQTTRADNAPLQASDPPKRVKTEQPNQTMENRVPLHEQHNYRTEIGVIRGTPSIVGPIKDQCLTLPCRVLRPERKDKEIEDVLDVCTSLDLDRAKFSLLEFLDNRLKQPGSANGIPPKWNNISNPCEIFNALQMIKTNSLDAKIHRAFGQIRLFWSVEESCTDETTVSSMRANGNHEAPHLVILEEWARKHAGPVAETEQRQKIHEYQSEYVAGRRWLEVAEWFGGPGIVLVSVCAGIGSRYVTHGWTDFQRDCLRHISQNLHSIKQLVEALGSNALDSYCSYGFLDRGTVAKIGNVTGYLAIDVDEEDSEENGGDGNEPRRLEDGSPEVANGGDGNSESESEPED